ncbi:MAG: FAD-binding oxidoreductase [Acidobacteriota bacterium]
MTSSAHDPAPIRRLDGWGFVGHQTDVPRRMLEWLDARLERGPSQPRLPLDGLAAALDADSFPTPRPLPDLGPATLSTDLLDRLRHARGQALPDLVRLRHALAEPKVIGPLPDAVARPRDDAEVEALLAAAAASRVRVVPWGGGTSVTGGAQPPPGDTPTVTLDLEHLAGLEALDEESGLATFGAGTFGPALESALTARGFELGHYPQSFELSTLGGWIAAQSSGQESLGRGRIADLVAGLEVMTPRGRLHLPTLPSSAGGPDLRRLLVGSEGRFGVITRATVRVRRRIAAPDAKALRVEAVLLRDWQGGVEAARRLLEARVPLDLLRLSDEPETAVALSIGLAKSRLGPLAKAWLRLRGVGGAACLLLLGVRARPDDDSALHVDATFEAARRILRPSRPVWLGAGPGRTWVRDRFHHPYLRDALLDVGLCTETIETAAPWSRLSTVYHEVGNALRGALGARDVPVLCHLSHPYADGASLYFTFFFPCAATPRETIERWATLKRRAADAIAAVGAATSHHHGVGSWHTAWLEREIGPLGIRSLDAVAQGLDPDKVLNPHVLLDPTDRLVD